jgi:large subunit ribosomal protein L28
MVRTLPQLSYPRKGLGMNFPHCHKQDKPGVLTLSGMSFLLRPFGFSGLGTQIVLETQGGWVTFPPLYFIIMSRKCELTGVTSIKGSHIWRSGKAKKKGGIGTHVTAITKRRFFPNLQRVKAVINGEVRYIRVSAKAIKAGLVIKAPKRRWSKDHAAAKPAAA